MLAAHARGAVGQPVTRRLLLHHRLAAADADAAPLSYLRPACWPPRGHRGFSSSPPSPSAAPPLWGGEIWRAYRELRPFADFPGGLVFRLFRTIQAATTVAVIRARVGNDWDVAGLVAGGTQVVRHVGEDILRQRDFRALRHLMLPGPRRHPDELERDIMRFGFGAETGALRFAVEDEREDGGAETHRDGLNMAKLESLIFGFDSMRDEPTPLPAKQDALEFYYVKSLHALSKRYGERAEAIYNLLMGGDMRIIAIVRVPCTTALAAVPVMTVDNDNGDDAVIDTKPAGPPRDVCEHFLQREDDAIELARKAAATIFTDILPEAFQKGSARAASDDVFESMNKASAEISALHKSLQQDMEEAGGVQVTRSSSARVALEGGVHGDELADWKIIHIDYGVLSFPSDGPRDGETGNQVDQGRIHWNPHVSAFTSSPGTMDGDATEEGEQEDHGAKTARGKRDRED